MSVEKVKEYLKKYGRENQIMEFDVSSATVELAAKALNTENARIAKTISFKSADEKCILVVMAGDKKIDNKKFKDTFGIKAKMLTPDEAFQMTGFAVGGVCPFAVDKNIVTVYTDTSLKRFDTVFPACGSSNSAIELTCDELFEISQSNGWVDISKDILTV